MPDTETGKRKSYGQFCPISRAMDILGDRWSVLIIRELLGGPAHFQDLYDGLPGIPKNLLSSRLRRMESDEIVRRTPQGKSVLYTLTPHGAAVRSTLEQLAFWGSRMAPVSPAVHPRSVRAIAMALQAILTHTPENHPDGRRTIELEVDSVSVEVVLGPTPLVSVRPVIDADAHIRTSSRSLSDYLDKGSIEPDRMVHVSGDPTLAVRFLAALGHTS